MRNEEGGPVSGRCTTTITMEVRSGLDRGKSAGGGERERQWRGNTAFE